MRTFLLPLSLAVALVFAASDRISAAPQQGLMAPKLPKGFKLYKGPWFNVFYPATWKASAAPLSKLTPDNDSDGAFFTAPDGTARFYVFSPQWNGKPTDAMPQKGETVVSRQIKTSSDAMKSQIVTTWMTIRGPKNAYTRSVVDVDNRTLNVRHAYAFQYRDAATYRKYLPAYITFKNSLQQFAD